MAKSTPVLEPDIPGNVLVAFCRTLPGVTADIKWGENLVFSVADKMFALFDLPSGTPFAYKVDPLLFSALTEKPGIDPAPYMARLHWVSVTDRSVFPIETLKDFLRESHRLVALKLPKKTRQSLGLE